MIRPRFLNVSWGSGSDLTDWDRAGAGGRRPRKSRRFTLESLESRTLLSTITEYPVPKVSGSNAAPAEITSAGGKLWFTDEFGNAIGMIDPSHPTSVQSYSQGLSGAFPLGITTGPDGNIWFTEPGTQSIGILSTANPTSPIQQFNFTTLGTPLSSGIPAGITSGPDGNIWFTDSANNAIGKITVTANPANDTVTEFPIPAGMVGFSNSQSQIIAGPEGKLYFTEVTFNLDHTVSKSAIGSYKPSANTWGESALLGAGQQPFGLTVGPDQNVWLTEVVPTTVAGTFSSSAIEAIDPTQATPPVISLIPTTMPAGGVTPEPYRITAGQDGALWFSDTANSAIGMVKLASGTVTMFPVPNTVVSHPQPQGITSGPDGNIWFADFNNAVGVRPLNTQVLVTGVAPNPVNVNATFNVSVSVTWADSGNPYKGSAVTALWNNPTGATLGGGPTATTATLNNGMGTFTGLTLNKVGSGYTLIVAGGNATTFTGPINVVQPAPSGATHLGVAIEPPVSVNPSQPFGLTVLALTASNTVDSTYTGSVTISMANNPGGAALGGTLTMDAVNGIATFTGLTLSSPGFGYVLSATSGSLTQALTSAITVTQPITRTPPAEITPSTVIFTQKTNKKGKKIGKPVLTGFQINFNTTMNPVTTGNQANYSLGTYVQVRKRVGRKIVKVLQLQPVGFSVVNNPSNNSVTLLLSGKQTFLKGGQITLIAAPPGGISSSAGGLLDGNGDGTGGDNAIFTISTNARGISRA